MAWLHFTRAFYPDETHTSEPVKAFYDGIRFVYPNWHLPYNNSAFKKTMSSRIIKDHFAELSTKYNYKIVPLHDELIMIARFLRNDPNRIEDAIELLQWNAENYPMSAVNWETLGDTYMKLKDEKKALVMYQNALALSPGSTTLTQKLNSLNK
jgi:tetratricopeptide (TPR) repeat protein